MVDQDPVPEPRDIPEIRLRAKFDLKLSSDQGFTPSSMQKFQRLSVNDKQKLLLQLPIPAIRKYTGGDSKSNTRKSKSTSKGRKVLNEPILAELVLSDRNTGGLFTIEGRSFEYEHSSYEHVRQFFTPIWEKNRMGEDEFFSKYVQPYLNRFVNYATLYSDEINDVTALLTAFQIAASKTGNKLGVEKILERRLYNPIEKPLLESLDHFKGGAKKGLPKDGAKQVLNKFLETKAVEISPPLDVDTSMIPFFNTSHDSDLKMLGLSMLPDASLGYYFEEDSNMVGIPVGYIEVKTPSFALEECYKKLIGSLPDTAIYFDQLETSSLKSKTLEFMKTIRKYCTMCVHTGCDRFILVDYESYVFVHLDKSVSLVQKDRQEESLQMTAEPGKSEIQRAEDQLVEEDTEEGSSRQMTDAPVNGKGRKEKSKTQGSEPPKVQKTNNGNTSGESEPSLRLHLIDGRHFWMSRKHPHVRLYVLAFLAMSDSRWDEMKSFQEKVIALMNVAKEKTEREEEVRHNRPSVLQNTSAKLLETVSQHAHGNVSMALSPSGDDSFYFEKNIFEGEYKIDFGPVLHSLLRVAACMNSQVISIYSKKFIEKLSPIHPIFGKDIHDISVLKIFDPLWGKDLEDDEDYTYADGVDMCTHELKVYEKLRDLMGSYVPWIFTYGRTVDIHVASGQRWPRFWGSFIQMEYIEPDRTFAEDISLDFVLESIIPVYEKLHRCGVVQNDFKLSNFIITRDHHEVKIIDFSSAIITNDENLFKEEIRDIKRYFDIPI